MTWWSAAAWGLAGGTAAGLASLMTAVIKGGFTWPWHDDHKELGPRLFVFTAGLVLGALVAAATHASISGAWPAFALGIGALSTVQGLVSGIEVSEHQGSAQVGPQSSKEAVSPGRQESPQLVQEEGVSDGGS